MTLPAGPTISISDFIAEMALSPASISNIYDNTKAGQRSYTLSDYYNKAYYIKSNEGNCNNGNCTNNCNCGSLQCVNCFISGTVNCTNCDARPWLQNNCNCACTYNCNFSTTASFDCDCQCQCGGGGDCGCCCFVAGTKVQTLGEFVPIEVIEVGDTVMGGGRTPTKVIGIIKPTLEDRPLYIVDGNGVTGDHLFRTPDGWACVDVNRYAATRWGKVIDVNGRSVNIGSVHPSDIKPLVVGSEIVSDFGIRKVKQVDAVKSPDTAQVVYSLITASGDYLLASGHVVDGIPQ